MNKYGNKKYIADGIQFDSKKEGMRYLELKLLQKAGKIERLILQKPFELIPTRKYGKETVRGCKYVADFYYWDKENNEYVAEDTKGFETAEYKVKKKIFLEKYVLTGMCSFLEYGEKIKIYKKK